MKINTSVANPINTSFMTEAMSYGKNDDTPLYTDYNNCNVPTSSCSQPDLVDSSDLQEVGPSNLSMENLLLNNYIQSEQLQKNSLNYLFEKRAILTQELMETKKKIIHIHKNCGSTLGPWHTVIDIILPLCTSIVALSLGLSPNYPLPKIPAICISIIGFAISGLKMADIQVANYLSPSYIAIFNLYVNCVAPNNQLFIHTLALSQTIFSISEYVHNKDNNFVLSEEALANKILESIEQRLKNITLELTQAMKMVEKKRKLFSIITDHNQLNNRIASIGAV